MEKEKFRIAKDFILPKEKKENGIDNIDLHFSSKAITSIIRHYTMESGVRSLQRQIASICRKIAKKIVLEGKTEEKTKLFWKKMEPLLELKESVLEGKTDEELVENWDTWQPLFEH